MDVLTDLEHLRRRPGMYVGDTKVRGLHHVFSELLDNSIDQFLAGKVTMIRVSIDGEMLEFIDDGPGLPFDESHESGISLATRYLTVIRRNDPTADGHTPHVHLGGWGCGLRVVTALTNSCEVSAWRNGNLWQQTFSKGIEIGSAQIIRPEINRGTIFRLTIDREIFNSDWNTKLVEERLTSAAYLFPGLRVESPNLDFRADRGLAIWAAKLATESTAMDSNRVCWINGLYGDLHIQAALAGTTTGDTQWRAFANGNTSIECGSHLTALQQVISAYKLKPAVAMIHVIMQNPRFAGPTRSKLDVPEIISPIYHSLEPDIKRFSKAL